HWYPFRAVTESLSSVGIYQISPASAREPGDPSGRKELGRTGTNLPAAVQHLQKTQPEALRELVRHMQKAVSTFSTIETDYVETKQLGLFVKEKGVGRRWFSTDLSDGTLRTLAIFVPLLDSRLSLVAIEEPEDGIHPWIIDDFINTCRERSQQKQVVLTTHSPILVSNLRPAELYLVDRREGATKIYRAAEVDRSLEEIIKEGVMDLGNYWNSGQMSAVPGGPSLFDLIEGENDDAG
ncbi:MAG: AAA family ATPase, partial [Phycisphaerales bacterium]